MTHAQEGTWLHMYHKCICRKWIQYLFVGFTSYVTINWLSYDIFGQDGILKKWRSLYYNTILIYAGIKNYSLLPCMHAQVTRHLKNSPKQICPICPPVAKTCCCCCTNREVSVWSTPSLCNSFPWMEYKWRQGSNYTHMHTHAHIHIHVHAHQRHTQRVQGKGNTVSYESLHPQAFNATASNT